MDKGGLRPGEAKYTLIVHALGEAPHTNEIVNPPFRPGSHGQTPYAYLASYTVVALSARQTHIYSRHRDYQ